MIDIIIINYFNLLDIYYKVSHKIPLLLLLSYNDKNSILNMIPRDVIMYVLRIIYYDQL